MFHVSLNKHFRFQSRSVASGAEYLGAGYIHVPLYNCLFKRMRLKRQLFNVLTLNNLRKHSRAIAAASAARGGLGVVLRQQLEEALYIYIYIYIYRLALQSLYAVLK